MDVSLYFHIPFCKRRCGYCDFNTFAGLNSYIPEYVKAIGNEAKQVIASSPIPLIGHTIFFGGGTPSLISVEQYSTLLSVIRNEIPLEVGLEITLEANPGTVSKQYFQQLIKLGFNRVSLGMQSAIPEELRTLDRQHTHFDVINTVQWAKQAGFKHINLDLIFGIPGQTLESWRRSLDLAVFLKVDHLSLYSLTIEDGTPLKQWLGKGFIPEPDDDLTGEMYEYAMEILAAEGFKQYEISNWSKGGDSQCKHNLQYWRFQPYLGFGAGAHGFIQGVRTENVGSVQRYMELMQQPTSIAFPYSPVNINAALISVWDQMQENMMVSLRLTSEGVLKTEFYKRFGIEIDQMFSRQINKLNNQGLIEEINGGGSIRLTHRGRLLGNQVFMQFIGNKAPKGYEYLQNQYT